MKREYTTILDCEEKKSGKHLVASSACHAEVMNHGEHISCVTLPETAS